MKIAKDSRWEVPNWIIALVVFLIFLIQIAELVFLS